MDVGKCFNVVMCAVVAVMICVVLFMGFRKNPQGKRMYVTLAAMMFMQYAIWGVYFVTMGSYLGQGLKFEGSDIGNIYSVQNVAGIISPFLIGLVADRYFSSEKVVGIMYILGGAIKYFLSCTVSPTAFLWLFLLYSITYMPTIPLTNAIAFNQFKDPGAEFPLIRVWGTIGWIVVGLIIGICTTADGTPYGVTAIPMKICCWMSIICGVLAFFLPHTPPKGAGKQVSFAEILGLRALRLFRDRSFLTFALASCALCIPLAFYYAFTANYLQDVGMESVAAKMTLGQMSELICMVLIPFFFARLGVKKMLIVGMFAWTARYLSFAFGGMEDGGAMMAGLLYLGIILHGVCYDFFFVTGQIYVEKAAPTEIQASAQGLLTFLTYGLGMAIGSVIAGRIVNAYETISYTDLGVKVITHNWQAAWLWPGIMAAVIAIVFLFAFKDREGDSKINID